MGTAEAESRAVAPWAGADAAIGTRSHPVAMDVADFEQGSQSEDEGVSSDLEADRRELRREAAVDFDSDGGVMQDGDAGQTVQNGAGWMHGGMVGTATEDAARLAEANEAVVFTPPALTPQQQEELSTAVAAASAAAVQASSRAQSAGELQAAGSFARGVYWFVLGVGWWQIESKHQQKEQSCVAFARTIEPSELRNRDMWSTFRSTFHLSSKGVEKS